MNAICRESFSAETNAVFLSGKYVTVRTNAVMEVMKTITLYAKSGPCLAFRVNSNVIMNNAFQWTKFVTITTIAATFLMKKAVIKERVIKKLEADVSITALQLETEDISVFARGLYFFTVINIFISHLKQN